MKYLKSPKKHRARGTAHFHTLKNPTHEQLADIEEFVKVHPDATFFQSPRFFTSCQSTPLLEPSYFVAYDDSGHLVGILLAFRQVQYRFFPLNFLSSRYIIWGGPLVANNDTLVYRGLYKEYTQNASPAIYTQVRNLSDHSHNVDWMMQMGYTYEAHLDIVVDLKKSEDQLWKEVHTKRRNEIRRAIQEGTSFEIRSDEEALKNCYGILEEVYHRAKLPLPSKHHFQALLENSSGSEGLKLFVANYEGKIIGCMLCLAYGTTLFDYYAGAYREYYNKYPNDLVPWEVFRWGKQNGFTRFAFGGAGKPNVPYGVRDYKKKFGGEFVNYGRFEKIHYPGLFKLILPAFKLWKMLKK